MDHKRLILLIWIALTIFKLPLFSQVEYRTVETIESLAAYQRAGQTSMAFLASGAGARRMAMGDAGLAMGGDVSVLFYNPAGLVYVDGKSIMLGSMNWLMDTRIHTGAFSINLGKYGVLGLSGLFYDYGDPIIATEIAQNIKGYNVIGEMNPSEFMVGLGYAYQISNQFAIGGQIKLAHQDLLGSGGVKTRTYHVDLGEGVHEEHDAIKNIVAFDFGTIYNTGFRDLSFAMSFRNFGPEIKYEREGYDLPLQFRFGLSSSIFKLMNKASDDMDLILNLDYLHPRDWSERIHVGLEYSFMKLLYLRSGYKTNYSSEGLCLGFGLNLKILNAGNIKVDYSYKDSYQSLFDNYHVYTISFDF